MTKGAALQQFFEQFMSAYATNSVPDDVIYPYLTYDAVFDAWGGMPVSLTVKMWFHTASESIPNAKVHELSETLGTGGAVLECDDGFIWLTRGTPFCQALANENDRDVKLRNFNVSADFLCKN